ncbi:MAG: hypothetical protein M4579_006001 [Chaenotheca gracillima]|nr:MAG: hypothetical protein M4579_006001 [Chaenotheca gracillima]
MPDSQRAGTASFLNGSPGAMTTPPPDEFENNDGGTGEQQEHNVKRSVSSSSAKGDSRPQGRQSGSPKKRRKVNHGHLCHDAPRDQTKKIKDEPGSNAAEDEDDTSPKTSQFSPSNGMPNSFKTRAEDHHQLQETEQPLPTSQAPQIKMGSSSGVSPPSPVSGSQAPAMDPNDPLSLPSDPWDIGLSNPLQDLSTFYPASMFNAPEVTHEYNLLNDFLSNSLLDDSALYSAEEGQGVFSDPAPMNAMPASNTLLPSATFTPTQVQAQGQPSLSAQAANAQGNAIPRPVSVGPNDKARETYYMTAADPSGNESPEERMNKLLQAKQEAGLLRPFNYVKGYARLSQYMDKNMQPVSRQKILRQLEKFRPKFRERMQKLTDMELILVEMWFEPWQFQHVAGAGLAKSSGETRRWQSLFMSPLTAYEMWGKVAIHEIFEEESLVSYWEKFGTIAFDNAQKAMLTSCFLKNPDPKANDSIIHCCFSFTIRRDSHNIPSMIVGNFLPADPLR